VDEMRVPSGIFGSYARSLGGSLAARRIDFRTFAPSSANRSAVARPIPPPPPVMNATLPARRAMKHSFA
jgi:hypothetical protein